jgi:hypothetical protein
MQRTPKDWGPLVMTSVVQKRPAVRVPFRFLAAVICLTALVVIVGTGYMAWQGVHALQVKDVVMLPGVLWLMRLMFLAAVGRTVPPKDHVSRHDHWPFASARVAGCYWLLVIVFF